MLIRVKLACKLPLIESVVFSRYGKRGVEMKYGKKNVVVLLIVALLGCIQGAMAQSTRIAVHPTAWTQLGLKGVDKDLAAKIAAQITANPANAEALIKALVAANPEHAAAIVSSAIVTLDGSSTLMIVAAAVSAGPGSAAAISGAAASVAPDQAAAIARVAATVAPGSAAAIQRAVTAAAPRQGQSIYLALAGVPGVNLPTLSPFRPTASTFQQEGNFEQPLPNDSRPMGGNASPS